MEVGLNITGDIRVNIGDTFKDVINKLDNGQVKYKIPYRGKDIQYENEESIVIFLDDYGIELNILNNAVVYIKSTDYKSNILFNTDECNGAVEIIEKTISSLCEQFNTDESNISIESFDFKSLNAILRVRIGDKQHIRLSIVHGAGNIAHINTIRIIDSKNI